MLGRQRRVKLNTAAQHPEPSEGFPYTTDHRIHSYSWIMFLYRISRTSAAWHSTVSIQGNSGPMVLHKCLSLATCIRSNPIESGFFSQNLAKNPEKQTKFEGIPPVRGDTLPIPPNRGNSFKFRLLFRIFRQIL